MGAEASTAPVWGLRRAELAQAELTGGAERSSMLRHETNVESQDQPEGCT
jgi:hypothetical protein